MDELLRRAKRMVMTAENARKTREGKTREGMKWQTRRIMKPQPKSPGFCSTQLFWAPKQEDIDRICALDPMEFIPAIAKVTGCTLWASDYINGFLPSNIEKYASYHTGDLCWIAEPYQIFDKISLPAAKQERVGGLYDDDSFFCIVLTEQETARFRNRKFPYRYTTGRFMYKSLARTIVEIKHVWTEQIQDIDVEDAIAEGYGDEPGWGIGRGVCSNINVEDAVVEGHPLSCVNAKADGLHVPQAIEWFHELWDSINKARGFGWDINPWVYAYEYELVKKLR